jgi:hypothetical protein
MDPDWNVAAISCLCRGDGLASWSWSWKSSSSGVFFFYDPQRFFVTGWASLKASRGTEDLPESGCRTKSYTFGRLHQTLFFCGPNFWCFLATWSPNQSDFYIYRYKVVPCGVS